MHGFPQITDKVGKGVVGGQAVPSREERMASGARNGPSEKRIEKVRLRKLGKKVDDSRRYSDGAALDASVYAVRREIGIR